MLQVGGYINDNEHKQTGSNDTGDGPPASATPIVILYILAGMLPPLVFVNVPLLKPEATVLDPPA